MKIGEIYKCLHPQAYGDIISIISEEEDYIYFILLVYKSNFNYSTRNYKLFAHKNSAYCEFLTKIKSEIEII